MKTTRWKRARHSLRGSELRMARDAEQYLIEDLEAALEAGLLEWRADAHVPREIASQYYPRTATEKWPRNVRLDEFLADVGFEVFTPPPFEVTAKRTRAGNPPWSSPAMRRPSVTLSDSLFRLIYAWMEWEAKGARRDFAALIVDRLRAGESLDRIAVEVEEMDDGEADFDKAWHAAPHECRYVMRALRQRETHEDDDDRRCVEFHD